MEAATVITTPAGIERFRMLSLRGRLRIELANPAFARGSTGALTMRAAKHFFPGVKSRKAALARVEAWLEAHQ